MGLDKFPGGLVEAQCKLYDHRQRDGWTEATYAGKVVAESVNSDKVVAPDEIGTIPPEVQPNQGRILGWMRARLGLGFSVPPIATEYEQ